MVKKIMIVDDDPGVVYTVKQGIEGLDPNYQITPIENGRKCLEILEKGNLPDLLLLDIMMPDMNGWEIHQEVRKKISATLPIVFLTARTDRIAKNAGDFLGDDYIEKPFKIPELKERLDRLLDKKE